MPSHHKKKSAPRKTSKGAPKKGKQAVNLGLPGIVPYSYTGLGPYQQQGYQNYPYYPYHRPPYPHYPYPYPGHPGPHPRYGPWWYYPRPPYPYPRSYPYGGYNPGINPLAPHNNYGQFYRPYRGIEGEEEKVVSPPQDSPVKA